MSQVRFPRLISSSTSSSYVLHAQHSNQQHSHQNKQYTHIQPPTQLSHLSSYNFPDHLPYALSSLSQTAPHSFVDVSAANSSRVSDQPHMFHRVHNRVAAQSRGKLSQAKPVRPLQSHRALLPLGRSSVCVHTEPALKSDNTLPIIQYLTSCSLFFTHAPSSVSHLELSQSDLHELLSIFDHNVLDCVRHLKQFEAQHLQFSSMHNLLLYAHSVYAPKLACLQWLLQEGSVLFGHSPLTVFLNLHAVERLMHECSAGPDQIVDACKILIKQRMQFNYFAELIQAIKQVLLVDVNSSSCDELFVSPSVVSSCVSLPPVAPTAPPPHPAQINAASNANRRNKRNNQLKEPGQSVKAKTKSNQAPPLANPASTLSSPKSAEPPSSSPSRQFLHAHILTFFLRSHVNFTDFQSLLLSNESEFNSLVTYISDCLCIDTLGYDESSTQHFLTSIEQSKLHFESFKDLLEALRSGLIEIDNPREVKRVVGVESVKKRSRTLLPPGQVVTSASCPPASEHDRHSLYSLICHTQLLAPAFIAAFPSYSTLSSAHLISLDRILHDCNDFASAQQIIAILQNSKGNQENTMAQNLDELQKQASIAVQLRKNMNAHPLPIDLSVSPVASTSVPPPSTRDFEDRKRKLAILTYLSNSDISLIHPMPEVSVLYSQITSSYIYPDTLSIMQEFNKSQYSFESYLHLLEATNQFRHGEGGSWKQKVFNLLTSDECMLFSDASPPVTISLETVDTILNECGAGSLCYKHIHNFHQQQARFNSIQQLIHAIQIEQMKYFQQSISIKSIELKTDDSLVNTRASNSQLNSLIAPHSSPVADSQPSSSTPAASPLYSPLHQSVWDFFNSSSCHLLPSSYVLHHSEINRLITDASLNESDGVSILQQLNIDSKYAFGSMQSVIDAIIRRRQSKQKTLINTSSSVHSKDASSLLVPLSPLSAANEPVHYLVSFLERTPFFSTPCKPTFEFVSGLFNDFGYDCIADVWDIHDSHLQFSNMSELRDAISSRQSARVALANGWIAAVKHALEHADPPILSQSALDSLTAQHINQLLHESSSIPIIMQHIDRLILKKQYFFTFDALLQSTHLSLQNEQQQKHQVLQYINQKYVFFFTRRLPAITAECIDRLFLYSQAHHHMLMYLHSIFDWARGLGRTGQFAFFEELIYAIRKLVLHVDDAINNTMEGQDSEFNETFEHVSIRMKFNHENSKQLKHQALQDWRWNAKERMISQRKKETYHGMNSGVSHELQQLLNSLQADSSISSSVSPSSSSSHVDSTLSAYDRVSARLHSNLVARDGEEKRRRFNAAQRMAFDRQQWYHHVCSTRQSAQHIQMHYSVNQLTTVHTKPTPAVLRFNHNQTIQSFSVNSVDTEQIQCVQLLCSNSNYHIRSPNPIYVQPHSCADFELECTSSNDDARSDGVLTLNVKHVLLSEPQHFSASELWQNTSFRIYQTAAVGVCITESKNSLDLPTIKPKPVMHTEHIQQLSNNQSVDDLNASSSSTAPSSSDSSTTLNVSIDPKRRAKRATQKVEVDLSALKPQPMEAQLIVSDTTPTANHTNYSSALSSNNDGTLQLSPVETVQHTDVDTTSRTVDQRLTQAAPCASADSTLQFLESYSFVVYRCDASRRLPAERVVDLVIDSSIDEMASSPFDYVCADLGVLQFNTRTINLQHQQTAHININNHTQTIFCISVQSTQPDYIMHGSNPFYLFSDSSLSVSFTCSSTVASAGVLSFLVKPCLSGEQDLMTASELWDGTPARIMQSINIQATANTQPSTLEQQTHAHVNSLSNIVGDHSDDASQTASQRLAASASSSSTSYESYRTDATFRIMRDRHAQYPSYAM